MPILTSAAIAIGTFVGKAAITYLGVGVIAASKIAHVVMFVFKAAVLIGLNLLLNKRERQPNIPTPERTEIFSSGPARWILGRAKVGGVVAYWGEDWNVSGTEGRGGPGADDLHLIMAVSDGSCDAIEAVWVAGERLEVKFNDDGTYKRRGQRDGDSAETLEGLPLDLDPGAPTYWNPTTERYYETEGGRELDRDDEDDAELIRRADLSGAVNIYPWLDGSATDRWRTIRTYTDRADSDVFGNATPFTDWTSEHQLRGIAGVHVRLRQWTKHNFDERVFTQSIPNIQFLIRGIKITHPDPNRSSGNITQWTNNAAAVRYWWHTQRLDIDPDSIDREAFVAAYRACETKITPSLPEEWPDGNEPDWASDDEVLSFRKYSIDGVLRSGEEPARIEAEFNDAWQGFSVEEGGVLHYYPGIDRVDQPISVDGDDLLQLPSWQPAPSITERTNAVTLSIEQSSFHNYDPHSLREIVDVDKRDEVDQGLHLPRDLGQWRWTRNPAQAYSLGVITLRRARHTGTLGLRLPPGTNAEPIKYLTMSPGLIYTINIPQEGFDGARMMLIDKRIEEESHIVDATFVEAPLGIYSSDYQLPDVPAPPAYVPTRMGSLPRKPTGLAVKHSAQVSDDGGVRFRVTASVDPSPLRKVFRLTFGDEQREIETASDSYTFSVQASRIVSMGVTARHVDKAGVRSLPVRFNFNPTYSSGIGGGIGSNLILPRPLWRDVVINGGSLRLQFERVDYGAPISGVEVRYTRLPLGTTTALPKITAETWENADVLRTEAIQPVRGLDLYVTSIASQSGRYALYVRYVARVSGADPVRSAISEVREVEVEIPDRPIVTGEESPLFGGSAFNLYKWVAKRGDAAGEPLLFPDNPLSVMRKDNWRGWVPDSPITTEPLARWPFGRCRSYGAALDQTDRSSATGLLTDTDSTVYVTGPIDLGVSKRVEVKAETFAYVPATDRQSNLTFGADDIATQRWGSGAITPIVLPEAEQPTGSITYSLLGLPAGLSFAPATRTLSGTPLIASASGTARYIARDEGGGEAEIEFDWVVGGTITAPGVPDTITAVPETTSATINWPAVANASSYDVQRGGSASGPWTDVGTTLAGTISLTGLVASTTYWVQVRAKNGAGASAYSTPISFTTKAAVTAPAVPSGLAQEARTYNSITVDWTSAENVTSYEVRWREKDVQSQYPAAQIATALASTEHTITGLEESTTYAIQVRGRNSAGPSDWSSELDVTTLAEILAAPTISSVVGVDATRDYLVVTINAYANLDGVKIEITSDPADGTHSATATSYEYSGAGPYQIYNIKPGHSYSVRVQGQAYGDIPTAWSAWSSLVFTGVPGLVRNLHSEDVAADSFTADWSAPTLGNPTSYIVQWWRKDSPTNKTQATTTSTEYDITGLDGSTVYRVEIKAVNATGTGLATGIDVTTAAATIPAPPPPTNRTRMVTSSTSVLLSWSEVETARTYEVEHTGSPSQRKVGLTGTQFEFGSLTADTLYTFRIRGRNAAGEGVWAQFVQVRTPPATASDYDFDSTAPMTLSRVSNDRTLSYSIVTTVDSGVAGFQIRYRQAQDSKTNDNVIPDWVILPSLVSNGFTSGQRTFTGTFDPRFSGRYIEAQVRALVDATTPQEGGGGSAYTSGLSAWHPISNSVTLTDPSRTLAGVIKSGEKPLSVGAISAEQLGSFGFALRADITPDPSQFETSAGGYEISDATENGAPREVFAWQAYRRGERIRWWTNDPYVPLQDVDTINFTLTHGPSVGDVIRFRVAAKEAGRTTAYSAYVSVTLAANDTIAPSAPDTPGPLRIRYDDTTAIFEWDEALGADGYEVSLEEDDLGSLDTTMTSIVQTGSGTFYEKVGGRNEHFTIKVRSYAGSGSGRKWSGYRSLSYGPPTDDYSVGKVTGLSGSPVGNNTRVSWNAVANAGTYQNNVSTDGGDSWLATSFGQSRYATVIGHADFLIRVRAVKGFDSSNPKSLSWTILSHKAESTPGLGEVYNVRWLVAGERYGKVALDWSATGNTSTYQIQIWNGSAWADLAGAESIPSSTTAWQTDASAYGESKRFRIRGRNSTDDGAWTEIVWLPATYIPLGQVSNVRLIASQKTIEVRWAFPDGVYAAEVNYREGTGAWQSVSVPAYRKHVTITGLEFSTRYRIRIRTQAGSGIDVRYGEWTSPQSVYTLACAAPSPPTSVGLSAFQRIEWSNGYLNYVSITFSPPAGGADSYFANIYTRPQAGGTWTFERKMTPSNADLFMTIVREWDLTGPAVGAEPFSVRADLYSVKGECDGTSPATYTFLWQDAAGGSAQEGAEGAVAAGSGASVNLGQSYATPSVEPISSLARPFFDGYIEERCFVSGSAIESFAIPAPTGGLRPYTLTVAGLPAGLSFDSATRIVSGTPSVASPAEGYAEVRVTDANGAYDARQMRWIVAGPTPSGWSEVGGGIGRIDNPFQIECTTKGNIRGLLWTGGATNAHDIENDEEQARGLMVWFRCPTTYPHTARLIGAAAVDFDLVVKVGDDFYFSDSTDDVEFVRVPGHENGALIGVYRYAATTTSTGSHNTGDPLVLEWYPDVIEAPAEASGDGASAAIDATGSTSTPLVPGRTETDVYLLYRNGSGAWQRRATALPEGWTDIGVNAREIRFEYHFKEWENRAVRRITWHHRDRQG